MKPKVPKPTAEELNLERQQLDELKSQDSEKARKRLLSSGRGVRSLITGSPRGVLNNPKMY